MKIIVEASISDSVSVDTLPTVRKTTDLYVKPRGMTDIQHRYSFLILNAICDKRSRVQQYKRLKTTPCWLGGVDSCGQMFFTVLDEISNQPNKLPYPFWSCWEVFYFCLSVLSHLVMALSCETLEARMFPTVDSWNWNSERLYSIWAMMFVVYLWCFLAWFWYTIQKDGKEN